MIYKLRIHVTEYLPTMHLQQIMFNHLSSSIFYLLPALVLVPIFFYKWLYSSSINQPPSPRKLPIIGNLHQVGVLPHRTFQLLSKQYGELMLLHLGSVPVLVASSADAAREIMKTHDTIFASRPKLSIPYQFAYGGKDIAFSPYGEYWRQVRSLSMLHLFSTKMVQSFRSVREEETSLMIEKIAKASSSSELVNFKELFVQLANDMVSRVTVGSKKSDGENGKEFMSLIQECMSLVGAFNVADYIPWLAWINRFNGLNARVEKSIKKIHEFAMDELEEHNKKREEGRVGSKFEGPTCLDFVDILLEYQSGIQKFPIQNETIAAIVGDMFAAGTDTTHTALEWAVAELIRNPRTMNKLQKEVRLIAKGKSEICEDDLMEMHYLKAVTKEALRLHPPSPFLIPRETIQDVKLMGYEIKAGTQVLINAWAIGRDPLLWDMPQEFQPERFLTSTIDIKGFDFELIPFGSGRRRCPGISFGIALNELALAKLVHKFNFALPDGSTGENLDMTEIYGLTVQKKLPIITVATPYCG